MKILLFFLFLTISLYSECQTVKIKHSLYQSEFDTTLNYPVKVTYWLTKENSKHYQKSKTINCRPDPLVPNQKSLGSLYKTTEYIGVKIATNDEVDNPSKSQWENCYYTNIVPQTKELNRGDWSSVDYTARFLASKNDSVMVTCGAYGEKGRIGKLAIPVGFWKILYVKKTNKYYYFHFFNNKTKSAGWESHSVDEADIRELYMNKF